MNALRRMLAKAVGRDEVVRAAKAQIVLREWASIVGPQLAARSQPDRYDKGTVWVAVQGSAWAQELRMSKDTILNRLRDLARDPSLFEDLRFGVRPLDPAGETPPASDLDVEAIKAEKRELSIREIAERRLKTWNDG